MSITTDDPPPTTIQIVYVTAPACRLCEHGRRVLAEAIYGSTTEIREVALLTVEGQRLVVNAGVPFPPAVFAGEILLAYGRLSAGALARQLDLLTPGAQRSPQD